MREINKYEIDKCEESILNVCRSVGQTTGKSCKVDYGNQSSLNIECCNFHMSNPSEHYLKVTFDVPPRANGAFVTGPFNSDGIWSGNLQVLSNRYYYDSDEQWYETFGKPLVEFTTALENNTLKVFDNNEHIRNILSNKPKKGGSGKPKKDKLTKAKNRFY